MLSSEEIEWGRFATNQPELIETIIESNVITDNDLKNILPILLKYYKKHNKLPKLDLLKKDNPALEKIFGDIEPVDIDYLKASLTKQTKANFASELINGAVEGTLELGDLQKAWKEQVYDDSDKVEHESEIDSYSDIMNVITNIENEDDRSTTSGFTNLDFVYGGGLKIGSTYCIVGVTGMGKTIFLTNIAGASWKLGNNILYITTEMNQNMTYDRILRSVYNATDTEALISKVEKEQAYKKKTFGKIKVIKVHPGDTSANDLENLVGKLDWKPDLIVVDYMDELKPVLKAPNLYEAQGFIARELVKFAEVVDAPLITATQNNRSAVGEEGGTKLKITTSMAADSFKKLHSFAGVATIIQDPDMKKSNTIQLSIGKNRYAENDVNIGFNIDYSTMKLTKDGDEIIGNKYIKKDKKQGDKIIAALKIIGKASRIKELGKLRQDGINDKTYRYIYEALKQWEDNGGANVFEIPEERKNKKGKI